MNRVINILKIIGIYAVLGFLLFYFILQYREDLGRKKAIESQQRAVATVTSLKPTILGDGYPTIYDVVYEYYDENEKHYSGIISLKTPDKDYVESLIGTEIEIYIDGNGACIRVLDAPKLSVNYYKYWCYGIVVLIAVYTVIWVNLAIRHHL